MTDLTTKYTKDTKGLDIFSPKLRALRGESSFLCELCASVVNNFSFVNFVVKVFSLRLCGKNFLPSCPSW